MVPCRPLLLGAAAVAGSLLAACSAPPGPEGGTGSGPTSREAPEVAIGIEHDGGTVALLRGQLLAVTLDSTYWALSVAPPAGPLVVQSRSVTPGGPACGRPTVPGSGCGVAELVVRGARDGTARVVGSRSTCGEALRCPPGQTGYEVRVLVTGRPAAAPGG